MGARFYIGLLVIVLGTLAGTVVLLSILGGMMALVNSARAHDAPMGWAYPGWCCNGNTTHGDCQAIAYKTVKPIPGGYRVTLQVGDHRSITKPHIFDVPQAEVRDSPDGRFHLCLYPTEDDRRCFFAPPPGV